MIFLSTVDANYPSYKSLAQTSETGFQSYHWSKIETTESTARYTLYNRLTVGQTEIGQWWSIFLSQSTEMGFQPISLPVGKKNSKLWQMTISELRVLGGARARLRISREGQRGCLQALKSAQYEKWNTIWCQITHCDIHQNTQFSHSASLLFAW